MCGRNKRKNKETKGGLLIEPRVAHKMIEPSDISNTCVPVVRRCGVASQRKGRELPKRHQNITAVASHELRATMSKRHMKVKLWESVDRESQGGEQGPS